MRSLIVFAVVAVVISQCVSYRIRRTVVHSQHHEIGGSEGHGHGATSYQNVHIENYHPVPVYIKKGHGEESKHKIGSVQHNVKVSHGHGKHEPGHAIVTGNNEGYGHESHGYESIAVGGDGGYGGQQQHLEKSGYEGYGDENNLGHASLESHYQQPAAEYEPKYASEHERSYEGGEQQGYASYEGAAQEQQQEGYGSYEGDEYAQLQGGGHH